MDDLNNIQPVGLAALLSGELLAVPAYQRSFAWKKKQVDHLLTDLAGAILRKTQGGRDDYFLGSVVLINRKNAARLELVDGQQRLATTSLIIAAIRDYHIQTNPPAANEYEKSLYQYDVPAAQFRPHLLLNEIDNRCYTDAILRRPKDRNKNAKWSEPSHKRLVEAFKIVTRYIRDLAAQYSAADATRVLDGWVKYLQHNAKVIRVVVADDADAFVVFETLNDRGLPLTIADLLKNFLLSLAGQRVAEAKECWAKMTASLQSLGKKDRTVDFIRHYWGSKHGITRREELFSDIRKRTQNEGAGVSLASELADEALAYAAIFQYSSDFWNEYGTGVRKSVEAMRLLRMERVRPLMLSVVASFKKTELQRALVFLESCSVRLILGNSPAGTVEEEILGAASKVRAGAIKNTKELSAAMKSVPNDAAFEASFGSFRVSNERLARYYLRALDSASVGSADGSQIDDSEDVTNLEHVMPQSASKRAALYSHLSPEKSEHLCYRLGNMGLMPTALHKKTGGDSFSEKKPLYAQCHSIALTKMLAEYDSWDEGSIDGRQKRLAKLALKAWPLKVS